MSIALVQQKYASISGPSGSTTLSSAPTAGNTLVGLFISNNNSFTITSITGGGVTWSLVKRQQLPSIAFSVEIWAGAGSSGSGTTLTVNTSSNYSVMQSTFSEWSGMPGTLATDGTNGQSTNGSPTSAGSVTPTAGKPVLLVTVGNINVGSGATVTGPSNGWTALTGSGDTNKPKLLAYDIVASASGSYSTGWTYTLSYNSYVAAIAAFDGSSSSVNPAIFLQDQDLSSMQPLSI